LIGAATPDFSARRTISPLSSSLAERAHVYGDVWQALLPLERTSARKKRKR
jgi:hypothetical protein